MVYRMKPYLSEQVKTAATVLDQLAQNEEMLAVMERGLFGE